MELKTALSIAGSDCSGGAGIQADIKTMIMNNVYAMSAITAITAQNTTEVKDVEETSPKLLREQIDAVFEDIYPDAIKIGMLPSKELVELVAERLSFYKAKNIVIDPVMISTSGKRLLKTDAIKAMTSKLFPLASLVTPNIPEASVLSGIDIKNEADMVRAARIISMNYNCSTLVKGGHSIGDSNDFLYCQGEEIWYETKKIQNENTHGTGCTLSSAIASNLAKGMTLQASVSKAKEYITGAIAANLNLGKGNGPLNHGYMLSKELAQ